MRGEPRDVRRELTAEEARQWYELGRCPFCRTPAAAFLLGPRGAAMRNVQCPICFCCLNVLDRERVVADYGWLMRAPMFGIDYWRAASHGG